MELRILTPFSAYSRKCQHVGDKYQLKEPEVIYQAHLAPEKL